MRISASAPMRCLRTSVLVAIAATGLAATVAPAAAVTNRVEKSCRGDYKRLCPSYKVGSSQLRACMEAKQSEISSTCIDALIDSGEVDRRRARR